MRPRIILRTHYQADEPRAIIATVTHCSSAVDSRHEDAVATAFVRWAKDCGFTLSLPGATYAVGNARTLGLLNHAHRWTSTGLSFGYLHAIRPAPPGAAGLTLTVAERRLYLKLYLEHGGALLVKFARWLLDRGHTTDDALRNESVIEALLVESLDEYLSVLTDIRERTGVRRERERLSRIRYASVTKRHKRYPLLRTLQRLGLIGDAETSGPLAIAPDAAGRLEALAKLLPDVTTLERVAKEDNLLTVVDAVYGSPEHVGCSSRLVEGAYSFAMRLGLQVCPLSYLDDVLFANGVLRARRPGSGAGPTEELLEPLHRERPSEVRFHVDRRGRRAFVLVTGDALNALRSLGGAG